MVLRISSTGRVGGLRRPTLQAPPRPHRAMDIVTIVNRSQTPHALAPSNKKDSVLQLRFEPLFRVLLYYHEWNSEEVKAKVKMCVPILTMRETSKIVRHAEKYGNSIVCTVSYDKAMLYCDALNHAGLNATLEEA